MGLVTDVIFLALSSVNSDLDIYVFGTGVSCEAVNNQEEYFRWHENKCFMVFPKNMLTSHIVFNVPFDLIDDQYYPLHRKPTHFRFTFVLVIDNPIIFD